MVVSFNQLIVVSNIWYVLTACFALLLASFIQMEIITGLKAFTYLRTIDGVICVLDEI